MGLISDIKQKQLTDTLNEAEKKTGRAPVSLSLKDWRLNQATKKSFS